MSIGRNYNKTEGGHRKGHSNVNHWEHTEDIKEKTKKARRIISKKIIKEQITLDLPTE